MKLEALSFSVGPALSNQTGITNANTNTVRKRHTLKFSISIGQKKKKKNHQIFGLSQIQLVSTNCRPRGDQAVVRDWSPSCGPTKFESPDQLAPYTHAVGNCPSRPLLVLCGPFNGLIKATCTGRNAHLVWNAATHLKMTRMNLLGSICWAYRDACPLKRSNHDLGFAKQLTHPIILTSESSISKFDCFKLE